MKSDAKRTSAWDDPINKCLGIVISFVVIGALLTLISAYFMGFLNFNQSIQNLSQRNLLISSQAIGEESSADDWQNYIYALLNEGEFDEAEIQFQRAKEANPDVTQGQQLLYIEAGIADARGDKARMYELLQEVADSSIAAYIEERDNGSDTKNWARANGLHNNVSISLAMIALGQIEDGNYEAALDTLNTFIEYYPQDAGMLAERARVKAELGDIAGAQEDYTQALRFNPHDETAQTALEQLENKEGN